jgi:hypothetical protein
MKRLSPAKIRLLCWLASGGTLTDRYGVLLPQPPLGAPSIDGRTVDSLVRGGLARWETRIPSGLAGHQALCITEAGTAALARQLE